MMIVGCVCVCVFSLYDAVLVVVFHKLVMCLRWIYIDVESFNGMVRKKKTSYVCVLCVFSLFRNDVCVYVVDKEKKEASHNHTITTTKKNTLKSYLD